MSEAVGSELDALAALLPFFDVRRLGQCIYCKCTAAWINSSEFGRHMWSCLQIDRALEIEAHHLRKAAASSVAGGTELGSTS